MTLPENLWYIEDFITVLQFGRVMQLLQETQEFVLVLFLSHSL